MRFGARARRLPLRPWPRLMRRALHVMALAAGVAGVEPLAAEGAADLCSDPTLH